MERSGTDAHLVGHPFQCKDPGDHFGSGRQVVLVLRAYVSGVLGVNFDSILKKNSGAYAFSFGNCAGGCKEIVRCGCSLPFAPILVAFQCCPWQSLEQ